MNQLQVGGVATYKVTSDDQVLHYAVEHIFYCLLQYMWKKQTP